MLDAGERERKYMKKKTKYTNEPLGELKLIKDFLPPPEALAFKEENMKVTISLSRTSINFFKHEAKMHHTKYQRLIRKVLDRYADIYQKAG